MSLCLAEERCTGSTPPIAQVLVFATLERALRAAQEMPAAQGNLLKHRGLPVAPTRPNPPQRQQHHRQPGTER